VKTLDYTIVVPGISVIIGLELARTIEPGKRVDARAAEGLRTRYGDDAQKRVAAHKATEAG
jgi:hypothetical protein